jgi:hypothetical protein
VSIEMSPSGTFAAARNRDLRWRISEGNDLMLHPVHIHGCQFRIISRDGKPPEAERAGWKDVAPIHSSPARPPLVKIAAASATALRAEERAAGRRTASSDFHPLEGDKSLRIESEQVPLHRPCPAPSTAGTAHWCIGCRATLSLPTNIFG